MAVLFDDAWAAAWAEQLRADPDYAKSTETWEGEVVLHMPGDREGGPIAVLLDTHRGTCRGARAATAADLDQVPFLLTASREQWRKLLSGEADPMVALMRGQLKLERGKLATLMGYTRAAKRMLRAAMQVPTEFPEAGSAGAGAPGSAG